MSLKDQAQAPPPTVSHLKQEKYPVYGLKWATLEAFLKKKFPNEIFVEKRVCHRSLSLFPPASGFTSLYD
jgi:hypothetical protein